MRLIKSFFNLFKPKVKPPTNNPEFEQVEWAFQFNNDEPCLFMKANNKEKCLKVIVRNKLNSKYVFNDGKGNQFKIFARQRTDN